MIILDIHQIGDLLITNEELIEVDWLNMN